MEKLPNSLPSSLNIKQFLNTNLTNEEKENIISIFNNIDNSDLDEDKTEGVISGEKAVKSFLADLRAKCGDKFNELVSNISNSYKDNIEEWKEKTRIALDKQQDEDIKKLMEEEQKWNALFEKPIAN